MQIRIENLAFLFHKNRKQTNETHFNFNPTIHIAVRPHFDVILPFVPDLVHFRFLFQNIKGPIEIKTYYYFIIIKKWNILFIS